MWYRIKPTKPPLEVLSRAALAAFLAEAATFAIYDDLFTRFDLTRWMNEHINDYVHSSFELAIFVLPALTAAYVTMRLVPRHGQVTDAT